MHDLSEENTVLVECGFTSIRGGAVIANSRLQSSGAWYRCSSGAMFVALLPVNFHYDCEQRIYLFLIHKSIDLGSVSSPSRR